MNGNERRNKILELLNSSNIAISASAFAKKFNVSRQIIVGDIALLRALGNQITSESKGYVLDNSYSSYNKEQIIVKHTTLETKMELEIFVSNNIIVLDVSINHPSYGTLKGELNIKNFADITNFFKKESNLLSSLTDGIHVHTVLYQNESDLKNALKELKAHGILYID